MALHNFNAAYGLADSLYGITLSETEFEDIALNGWSLIGNKHTRLYRYIGNVVDGKLDLPCNVDVIESVHIPVPDAQITTSLSDNYWTDNIWIESYIDHRKRLEDPYWTRGKLVKYDEGNNELYFSRNYPRVMVVYHGVIADEEGLPLVNEKELRAIAAFIAYTSLYKEAIKKRDGNLLKLAQTVKEDYLRLFNAARVKEYLNQNDMDRILDAKTSWARKSYGKSFKAIK